MSTYTDLINDDVARNRSRATLASSGIDVENLPRNGERYGESPLDRMSWSDLLNMRKSARKALNGLFEKVAGREPTAQEDGAITLLSALCAEASDVIDGRAAAGVREPEELDQPLPMIAGNRVIPSAGRGGGNGDMRERGRRLGLQRGETMVSRVAGATGEPTPGFGIGDLALAAATGEWSPELARYRLAASGMTGSDGTLGGFITPNILGAQIIDLARNQMRLAQAGVSIIPMDARGVSFATVESDPTAHWRGEDQEITESEMTLGERSFNAHTVAVLVRASLELLEDAPNASMVIEDAIAKQIALQIDYDGLFGSGVGKMYGLYEHTAAQGMNFIDSVAGALTSYDGLSLAVQACMGANVEPGDFIMSARTFGQLDRLQDEDNNPLRAPRSVTSRGMLVTNQVSDTLAPQGIGETPTNYTGASAIFTGYWPDYWLLVRSQLRLNVASEGSDEFKKMQVLIRGYARVDGFAVRPASFAIVRGVGGTQS